MFDVAIIGSGPSAVGVYRALVRVAPTIKICVLEAGGEDKAYSGRLGAVPSPGFRLSPTIYMGGGGTSELWHYVLAPLDKIDFEPRPYLGTSGWPISLEDLKPHYKSILNLLGVRHDEIFDEPPSQSDLDGLDLDGLTDDFEPKLFIRLKRRWRAKEFWKKQGVSIRYFHLVRKILINVRGVEIISSDNEGQFNPVVLARRVIVAAGGLNSPQILFNTDIQDAVKAHIGKTLLDHPMGVGMQLKLAKPYNFEIFTSKKQDGINKKIAFRLKDTVQKRDGLPNSSFFFKPSFKEGYSQSTEELKNRILSYRSYLLQGRLPFEMTLKLLRDWNLVGQIIAYKSGLLSKVALFDIFCVTEQISRESRIFFERGEDGFFRGKCSWRISEMDTELNLRCLSKIVNWSKGSSGHRRVTVPPEDILWSKRATSAAHHIGTIPMGSNVLMGAVDSNCAVFGLEETIFVADASVMPTAGCANVTLTSMAIADRVGGYVGKIL
jgi:choline dehydrogenase-like flavoprotein